MFKLYAVSVVAALCALTGASPVEKRDVWDPPVLTPVANSVLVSGMEFTVVWDTSNPPAEITNPIGMIVLVKDNEFLTEGLGSLSEPLAQGFNLTDGQAIVTVPSVIGADIDGYQFDVFGDSGNRSPSFTIVSA